MRDRRKIIAALVALMLGLGLTAQTSSAQIPGGLNATLSASPSPAQAGQLVTFTYSARPPAVAPPFASITGVSVNFGDGQSGSGTTGSNGQAVSGTLTHTYAVAGTYIATLSATASNGGSGSASTTVTVSGGSTVGSWLDQPLTSWNSAGMAIPRAPLTNQSGNDAFCAAQQRPPEIASDFAVVGAGWRLFGVYEGGWGVQVIGGQSDEDGMCRPTGYQYFVFDNGVFAGTLSPVTMDSRTEGATGRPLINSGGSMLSADFVRYTATDALCCPSSTTSVTYHVDTTHGAPVLVPDSADTYPNS